MFPLSQLCPGTIQRAPRAARGMEPALLTSRYATREEIHMGKGILLWLIGIPIPIIILLYLLF